MLQAALLPVRWKVVRHASGRRYCATSQKVAGSISDGVVEIFHRLNSPDRNAVDSASNINEYYGCLLMHGLIILRPSRPEILGASTSCSTKGLSRNLTG
jgi:hypothetical protein